MSKKDNATTTSSSSSSDRKRNFPIFEKNDENENAAKRQEVECRLKIWSWNVAGLRACVKKGGHNQIRNSGADLVILQETKCPDLPNEINALDDYKFKRLVVSNDVGGTGYAGIAMLAKQKPIKVQVGIGDEDFDKQGRFIQAEYAAFIFIGLYVPNSGRGLVNLAKRARWDQLLLDKIVQLDRQKPLIIAGDMNVAHEEIDLRNPETNRNKTAGFTDQERAAFTRLLGAGFVDVYRRRNPNKTGAYTYWSYIGNRKANNIGWRLDYFIVSERIYSRVEQCEIHSEISGSDHCPLSMVLNI